MKRIAYLILASAAYAFSCASYGAGVAGFHPDCAVCHQASPPSAENANREACVGCHGEAPEKGSVTADGKTLNPHKGHFDVFDCLQCHPAHKPGKNGCLECHKSVSGVMPEK